MTQLIYEPGELFRLFTTVLNYFPKSDIQEGFPQILSLGNTVTNFDSTIILLILKQFLNSWSIDKFIFYAKLSGVEDEKIFGVLEQVKAKFVS